MRSNIRYSRGDELTSIIIENTNSGARVPVQVASKSVDCITVFLAGEKIVLHKKNELYIANKLGMELVYNPANQ